MKKETQPKEKKNNKYIKIIIILGIIIILIMAIFAIKHFIKMRQLAYSTINEVQPTEVRDMYTYMVDISCYGDLHLDIKVDAEPTKVKDLNTNNLIDYMFSYLDKNNELTDEFDVSIIKEAEKDIFSTKLNLVDKIKEYQYGEYIYAVNGRKVTRKAKKCTSDKRYVTYLYGYAFSEDTLSVDVNVAYAQDSILYDYDDVKLGEYSSDTSKLAKLTRNTSYYRLNYIKDNNLYKLDSVEWKHRS